MIGFRCRTLLIALTGLLAATTTGLDAAAQQRGRMVYNPVTRRTEPELQANRTRTRATHSPVRNATVAAQTAPEPEVQTTGHYAACDCGDTGCVGGCGVTICDEPTCGLPLCGETVGCCGPALYTGFEFTFVKPRFERNVAFTLNESDGAGNDVITDTEFDYDLELSPRVFLGWRNNNGVGLRATWWHFDHEAATASTNPPANGFGSVTHPAFGTVDISSVTPSDSFTANSSLNAYTIDLEAVREARLGAWDLGVAGGLRYAFSEQEYTAQLADNAATLRGQIDYQQSVEGIGPTISLSASRPISRRLSMFCKGRGSVLFGDGESRLSAGEDLDLTTSFTTTRTTNRDDLLSIGEVQLGFRWQGPGNGVYRPHLAFAMEGQVWNGAGNATTEDGSLGFFGFTSTVGFDW